MVELQHKGRLPGGIGGEEGGAGRFLRWSSGHYKVDGDLLNDAGSEVSDISDLETPSYAMHGNGPFNTFDVRA